jgi:pilus assembly protein Flp/PilA
MFSRSPLRFTAGCNVGSNFGIPIQTWRNPIRELSRTIARYISTDSARGVTAIEYGLIASRIAVVIVAGITLIGPNLDAIFTYICCKVAAP